MCLLVCTRIHMFSQNIVIPKFNFYAHSMYKYSCRLPSHIVCAFVAIGEYPGEQGY